MSENKELKSESGSSEELKKEAASGSSDTVILTKEEHERTLKLIEDAKEAIKTANVAKLSAEDAIVKYKRIAKESGGGVSEIDEDKINEIVEQRLSEKLDERFSELDKTKKEKDVALDNASKIINELSEALKSKNSISNSGIGSNKDKQQPEDDLTKHFNEKDLAILKRSAQNKGVTIQEYIKQNRTSLGI